MPKPLRITGAPDKVEQAKRAVELLLANDETNRMSGGGGVGGVGGGVGGGGGGGGGGGMGDSSSTMMGQTRSMGEVIVPRSSVGIIIGKQGETIKRLANESGTKNPIQTRRLVFFFCHSFQNAFLFARSSFARRLRARLLSAL